MSISGESVKGSLTVPRKGGPKEARMKARGLALDLNPAPTYSLRFSNLPKWLTKYDLKDEVKKFGEVLSTAVPINMQTKTSTGVGFAEFRLEEAANAAMNELDGIELGGKVIKVVVAKQESIFSQDTGYITNEQLDHPEEQQEEFDSSMPESHYEVKYRNRPLDVAQLYTVKVDNLTPDISPEQVQKMCEQFGEVASCHRPMNLNTRVYHPFCFVKFVQARSALAAVEALDGQWLDEEELRVSVVKQVSYYGQDESTEYTDPVKLAKKKRSHR